MSRITELPDDYEERPRSEPLVEPLKEPLSEYKSPSQASSDSPEAFRAQAEVKDNKSHNSQTKDAAASTAPSLPPPLASTHGQSPEDMLSMMNRTPLFMTTLDETDGIGGENMDLEALKALAYEGSATEIAKNFKEQGNERYQAKIWKDAVEFYTKGLAVLEEARKRPKDQEGVKLVQDGEDEKDAIAIAETLLVNRAACNLELQNYRRAVQDCSKALTFNPLNIKAHYRLTTAHLALSALREAAAAIANALSHHPGNSSLLALQTRIKDKQTAADAKERAVSERNRTAKLKMQALNVALKARGIRYRVSSKPPELEDAVVHLEQPTDPSSILFLPTLFLYPLASQSDLVKAMPETDSLQDHLTYLLPTPWDGVGEYTVTDSDCYMETTSGGLAKVGKKMAMRKVLSEANVEILDGLVKVFIVPRAKSGYWIDDFKKTHIKN
ncbi:MAG: hypothetical protein M4579_000761 [Chaenotheca gracillima]|nr:MAG: hypothetical protein M4579_000761 [Chaenotheca gracillima]